MEFSLLVPFLFGSGVIAAAAVMMLYDPFRVGANLAQLALSIFLASMLSWALWLTGNIVVVSFYPLNVTAWEINVISAMIIGPVAVRFVVSRVALSYDSPVSRDIAITLAGAIVGAVIGRFILSEEVAKDYVSTGLPGTARVMWVWVGAILGGHAYAAAVAVRNVRERREP